MNESACRYISDQGKLREGCRNRAEYRVRIGSALGNYTESCAEHLGEMLDGHDRFEVFRIYVPEHDTQQREIIG